MRKFGIVFMVAVTALLLISLTDSSADAESLLGVPFPASATNIQVSLERDLFGLVFGDFQGYVRFELSSQDARALLNSPEFQNVQTTTSPQGIMGNAVKGNTPISERALQSRPSWWTPDAGLDKEFLVGYRSFQPSPLEQAGVDFAWYMIDISNPAQAVAYVYIVEV